MITMTKPHESKEEKERQQMLLEKGIDEFLSKHMMTHSKEDYGLKRGLVANAEFIFPLHEMGQSCLLIMPNNHEVYPSALIICLYKQMDGKVYSEKLGVDVEHESTIDDFMVFYPEDFTSSGIEVSTCSNPDCEIHKEAKEQIEKMAKDNGQPPCIISMQFANRSIKFPVGLYSQGVMLNMALNVWRQMNGIGKFRLDITDVINAKAFLETAKKAQNN